MASLEFWKKESLSRKEQEAFSELADTLIFDSPQKFKLSSENVPEFSRRMQDDFKKQDEFYERKRQRYLEEHIAEAVSKFLKSTDIDALRKEAQAEAEEKKNAVTEKPQERSFTEQVLGAARMYVAEHGREYWQTQGYGAWGFTPKLAGMRSKEYERPYQRDGKNCLGVVQALGGLFREMGVESEMGITADHPFAVVYIEGKTYLASLFGVHEARGTFQQHDGYKTYVPTPEDKIPYKLMTVWNFDEGLAYEVLENFEVLRQMSLGNKVENLPDTEEGGMKLAEQHRGTLQNASWRKMQEKVTPRLAKYFHTHEKEWASELERIVIIREIGHYFSEVMQAGQAATSLKDESFSDFKKKFVPEAKKYAQSIADFIVQDADFAPDTPPDVVHFTRTVKSALVSIPIAELRVQVTQEFLKPFLAKQD